MIYANSYEEDCELLEALIAPHRTSWIDRIAALTHLVQVPPVEEPEEEDTPERVLRREAQELGVRVLDLRKRDRTQRHGFRDHCVQLAPSLEAGPASVVSVRRSALADFMAKMPGAQDFGPWGWFGGKKTYDEAKGHERNAPKRGRTRGRLKWSRVTNLVLHTMAVHATAPRCVGMPVHHAVAKDGTIVLLQSIRGRMWHAHHANGFSSGLEISGKSSIADHQIGPVRALIRYDIASKRRNLGLLGLSQRQTISPHAFSHSSRGQDCGRVPWLECGVWAMGELGLELGPVVGSGKRPGWALAA